MPKTNQADVLYELFPEVCEVIDGTRKNYYTNVSDSERKIVKDFYNSIKITKNLSDEEKEKRGKILLSFLNRLNKADDLSISSTNFEVDKHLKKLNANLGNMAQYYIEDYSNAPQYLALPSRNIFRTDEFLSETDKEFISAQKKVDTLLNLFTKGNSETAAELKKLLKQYNIEIKITNETGYNGSMDCFPENNKAVLTLDKGLFDQDESVQVFMLAHELGHFIDYANRPQGSNYTHQLTEECFADIVAVNFVKEAGFDSSKVVNLFDKIENDTQHPRKEDRIAAIKSIEFALTYAQEIDRAHRVIKKAKNLFHHTAQQNDLNENLNILQKITSFFKENIYSSLKSEQKAMEEDDIPTSEYISQRTADIAYRQFAKKHFISDKSFERGYCTSLPLLVLKTINSQMASFGPSNDDPKEFVKEIKQKFPDSIYSSSEEQSLSDILKNKNISSGSFVIFDIKKTNGKPNENSNSLHTMIFKGMNQDGNCLCDGFDSEQHSYVLNQHRQCGYVIDIFNLIYHQKKQIYSDSKNLSTTDAKSGKEAMSIVEMTEKINKLDENKNELEKRLKQSDNAQLFSVSARLTETRKTYAADANKHAQDNPRIQNLVNRAGRQ